MKVHSKRPLFWRIYPSHLFIAFLCLAASVWLAVTTLRDSYVEQRVGELRALGRLLEIQLQPLLHPPDPRGIDRLCKVAGARVGTRITIVLPDGRVVGDSEEDPQKMDNHRDRPEVRRAFLAGEGRSTRFSRTVRKRMLYLGIRAGLPEREPAILRLSVPMTGLEQALEIVEKKIVVWGFLIALAAGLSSLLLARRLSRPIQELKRAADRLKQGDLSLRPPMSRITEVDALAETMHRMGQDLHRRIETVTLQRNEIESVLSSMVEGVLAVDTGERVIRMNEAAGKMLQCDPRRVQGRGIEEAIRNPGLQRFVKKALSAGDVTAEEDIVLSAGEELFVTCHGSALRDGEGRQTGALVVLNDVTRLRKLEKIRRDFVANVSHEIKTPITAVKGFLETLSDGAMKSPAEAARFLAIMEKHVLRLEAIVEDLLCLSRIEQEEERGGILRSTVPLEPILHAAVQLCEAGAAAKGIHIQISCPKDLTAHLNPPLLEQAVVNLLENAVKYSHPGNPVDLTAERGGGEIVIRVRDQGPGIDPAHHDRLFERFYRVDKARSRQEGGTGLGLSIVKHIVQAHGGRVTVQSVPGKGSAFTLHLPA